MKKLLALLTAAVMIAALALPVLADNYGTSSSIGDTVSGGEAQITKYLVTDDGTTVPDVTFTYKITAAEQATENNVPVTEGNLKVAVKGSDDQVQYTELKTGATYDSGTTYYDKDKNVDDTITNQETLDAALADINKRVFVVSRTADKSTWVYVGLEPEKVKITSDGHTRDYTTGSGYAEGFVSFSSADTSSRTLKSAASSEELADLGTSLATDQGFNTRTITLDFSDVTFKEPGIYRYYFEEEQTDATQVFELDTEAGKNRFRTIDVFVVDKGGADGSGSGLEVRSYVIYQGKLGSESSYEDIEYTYDVNQNFNPIGNVANPSVGMKEGVTWTYTGTDGTYQYTYEKDNGGWVEVFTSTGNQTTVKRNETTNLAKAYCGSEAGVSLSTTSLAEAIEMGASEDDIKTKIWTVNPTDETLLYQGLKLTYEWDPNKGMWHVTGGAEYTKDSPRDGSKPGKFDKTTKKFTPSDFVYRKGSSNETISHNNATYSYLKDTMKVADSELQSYAWYILLDGKTDGTYAEDNIYYYYDNDKWNVVADVDCYEDYSAILTAKDDAYIDTTSTSSTALTLNAILYSYAEKIEKQAQIDANYGYDTALAQNPNSGEAVNPKNDVFVNKYETVSVTIKKMVEGNQGSKDKYFKFTVEMTKPNGIGIVVEADKTNLDVNPTGNDATNYTQNIMKEANEADDDLSASGFQYIFQEDSTSTSANKVGSKEFDIYLQAGEYIVLKGVPAGTKYKVYEADANKDGYTTTALVVRSLGTVKFASDELDQNKSINDLDGVSREFGIGKNSNGATIRRGDHIVTFTNTKNGVIPTGVAIGVGAAAALVGIVVVYIIIRRRTRYAYEDEE